jgi:hypothetical protein
VGAKVVSRLSDQVEAKIARANRAFRLSSRVIVAAHRELESHGEWLDRHSATWAEEVKRHRRLLNRKLAMRALVRFVVGLVFAAPFALARSLEARLKDKPAPASPQPCLAEDAPAFSPQQTLQHRIRGLEGLPGMKTDAASRLAEPRIESVQRPSSPRDGWPSRVLAAFGNMEKRTATVFALGSVALLLVVHGALHGTPSTARAELTVATKQNAPIDAARASVTVPKTSAKAKRPAQASGFAVLETAPSPQALRAPPQTIADMIGMAQPVSLPPVEAETVPAPVAAAPIPSKPAAKAKPKRKLAVREPEPLPWWQEWSWIRVR